MATKFLDLDDARRQLLKPPDVPLFDEEVAYIRDWVDSGRKGIPPEFGVEPARPEQAPLEPEGLEAKLDFMVAATVKQALDYRASCYQAFVAPDTKHVRLQIYVRVASSYTQRCWNWPGLHYPSRWSGMRDMCDADAECISFDESWTTEYHRPPEVAGDGWAWVEMMPLLPEVGGVLFDRFWEHSVPGSAEDWREMHLRYKGEMLVAQLHWLPREVRLYFGADRPAIRPFPVPWWPKLLLLRSLSGLMVGYRLAPGWIRHCATYLLSGGRSG